MELKMIVYDEVPCWWELSWQEEEPSLLLKIHTDLIATLTFHPLVVQQYMQEFSFGSFTKLSSGTAFGFDNALQQCGEQNGFLVLKAPLPRIRTKTAKKCHACGGSGKEKYRDEKCWDCNGSGKEHVYLWKAAHALSASLTALSPRLWLPHQEIDTSVSFPQLLTIQTITQSGPHGGSLGGFYSKILCEWLRTLNPREDIMEMVRAMHEAYSHMMEPHPYLARNFRASLANGNGWLNVSCPGDACGLHPHDSEVRKEEGYQFSCHNIDNPAQQLTLLAGLAALHDRARRELTSAS